MAEESQKKKHQNGDDGGPGNQDAKKKRPNRKRGGRNRNKKPRNTNSPEETKTAADSPLAGENDQEDENIGSADSAVISAEITADEQSSSVQISNVEWLRESLQSLGFMDPTSAQHAADIMKTSNEQKMADDALVRITLWLEDRMTRFWDVNERAKLREDFWKHIDAYLEAQDCPKSYFRPTNAEEMEKNSGSPTDTTTARWRYDPYLRSKVMHWIVAIATSEAHGEQSMSLDSQQKDQHETSLTQQVNKVQADRAPSSSLMSENLHQELQNFPLGFSTGDVQVDDILNLIRMKLLLQLEEEQNLIQDVVIQMQSISVTNSKPLKESRPRAQPSKGRPPKRQNKGGDWKRGKKK